MDNTNFIFTNNNPIINYIVDNIEFKTITFENKVINLYKILNIDTFNLVYKKLDYNNLLFKDKYQELDFIKFLISFTGIEESKISEDLYEKIYQLKNKENIQVDEKIQLLNQIIQEEVYKYNTQLVHLINNNFVWGFLYTYIVLGEVIYDLEIYTETEQLKIGYNYIFFKKDKNFIKPQILNYIIDNSVKTPKLKYIEKDYYTYGIKGNDFFIGNLLQNEVIPIYSPTKYLFSFNGLFREFINYFSNNFKNILIKDNLTISLFNLLQNEELLKEKIFTQETNYIYNYLNKQKEKNIEDNEFNFSINLLDKETSFYHLIFLNTIQLMYPLFLEIFFSILLSLDNQETALLNKVTSLNEFFEKFNINIIILNLYKLYINESNSILTKIIKSNNNTVSYFEYRKNLLGFLLLLLNLYNKEEEQEKIEEELKLLQIYLTYKYISYKKSIVEYLIDTESSFYNITQQLMDNIGIENTKNLYKQILKYLLLNQIININLEEVFNLFPELIPFSAKIKDLFIFLYNDIVFDYLKRIILLNESIIKETELNKNTEILTTDIENKINKLLDNYINNVFNYVFIGKQNKFEKEINNIPIPFIEEMLVNLNSLYMSNKNLVEININNLSSKTFLENILFNNINELLTVDNIKQKQEKIKQIDNKIYHFNEIVNNKSKLMFYVLFDLNLNNIIYNSLLFYEKIKEEENG